jgi:hypothetical protein
MTAAEVAALREGDPLIGPRGGRYAVMRFLGVGTAAEQVALADRRGVYVRTETAETLRRYRLDSAKAEARDALLDDLLGEAVSS